MFFQIDDQLQVNPKAQKMARMALRDDPMGLAAMGLWTMAGSLVQAKGTDGVTQFEDLVSITLNAGMTQKLADLLVGVGLWHAAGHGCERCPAVEPEAYLYHDWFALGYTKASAAKIKTLKAKELKDPAIVAAVWARDCIDDPSIAMVGLCRYCAKTVRRKDTRSQDDRPHLDHVDPFKAVGVRNIVLACAACNRAKAQKLPEQAGMALRPAPQRGGRIVEPGTVPAPSGAVETPVEPVQARVAAAEERTSPETTHGTRPGTSGGPGLVQGVEGVLGRARGGTRPGGAGQGGVTTGLSNQGSDGVSASDTQPPTKARRRRRGKRKPSTTGTSSNASTPAVDPHDAGPAPEVEVAGRFGSPWHGWTGKPSEVTETTCFDHNEEMPCWKCGREAEGQ